MGFRGFGVVVAEDRIQIEISVHYEQDGILIVGPFRVNLLKVV